MGYTIPNNEFFMVIERGEGTKPIVIDVMFEPEGVGEGKVLQFFAKTLDVDHDTAIMIAIPRASEAARRMADSYGLSTSSEEHR